jgi:heme/copper-type cytochrome/quinol oxidase subunit 2
MNKNTHIIILLFILLFVPETAQACATCFGDPSAPAAQGMNWAIITLLGVTGGVLGGVIATIISIAKKTKKFQQLNKQ